MGKRVLSGFALSVVCCLAIAAQGIEEGQFPPGLNWKSISLSRYRLVFPDAIGSDAQRIARMLDELGGSLEKTMHHGQKPVTLILNNQTIRANGYVALAPRRAEWFTTPPQSAFAGAVEWYRLLALHEGRHLVQYDKVNHGFTSLAGVLFGEQGRAAATFFCVPTWVLEGEAVALETALTSGGRGRLPGFDMAARAQILAGRSFSYAKAYLGSYRDHYLDPYSLGYLMVAYTRRRFGADFWSQVLDRTSSLSYLLCFAFDRALTEQLGKSASELYREMVSDLKRSWQEKLQPEELTLLRPLTPADQRVWTNYSGPWCEPSGSVLAVRHGLADAPAIVRVHGGGRIEKLLRFSPAELEAARVSCGGGKLVWSERIPDPRWGKRDFSAIALYDLERRRSRRIKGHGRLLNPAISPDGKRIAAVEYSWSNECRLVILDVGRGQVSAAFPNPGNALILSPAWSESGGQIAFVRLAEGGMALTILNTESGMQRDVVACCQEALAHPAWHGQTILYSSSYSGIDNIYAVEIDTGRRFRVTSVAGGAFFPAVTADGRRLVLGNYTAAGMELAEMDLDPRQWQPLNQVRRICPSDCEIIAAQEKPAVEEAEKIPAGKDYPVVPYSLSGQLMNIHSWGIRPTDEGVGLQLISSDPFNLMGLQAGIDWHLAEKVWRLKVAGTYGGFSPIVDWGLEYGGRSAQYLDTGGAPVADSFVETDLRFGLRLPLDLSRGCWRSNLQLGIGLDAIHVSQRQVANGWHFPLSYRFRFSRYLQGALRDILPLAGQDVTLVLRHDAPSFQFYAQAKVIFPGLARHHGLQFLGAFQELKPGNYPFENMLLFPRGYDWQFQEKTLRLAIDYVFPLAYPDWALGNILYIKRLRVDLFFDHARGWNAGREAQFSSAGAELLADLHLFSMVMPLQLGVRASYRFSDRSVRCEPLVFSVGL